MKHAYLIMAHDDFYILQHLISLIDDERNDIYIHIDKKVKDFSFDEIKKKVKKSNLIFIDRIDVRWGNYSQIRCELNLFKASYPKHYNYYHLLSGIDLPLKSQNKIHDFFLKNSGKEFMTFDFYDKVLEGTLDRVRYYHFFTKNMRTSNKIIKRISNSLHTRTLNLEKKFKVNRTKSLNVRKGANWVSITDNLVGYIIKNEKFIKKTFSKSYCADELLVQTLVYNSEFYDNLYMKKDNDYMSSTRYIDWERGLPYTFESNDFDDLINSNYLFARKFSTVVDKNIIDMIYNHIKEEEHGKS